MTKCLPELGNLAKPGLILWDVMQRFVQMGLDWVVREVASDDTVL